MITIEQAYAEQAHQKPTDSVRKALGEISLLAFVGPSAAGKNFLMEQSGLHQVGTVTSRSRRPSDNESAYTYMTHEEMLSNIENRRFVQYGVALPDRIYASRLEDYSAIKTNVADIYFDAVQPLRTLGFKSVRTVNVLTPDSSQYHSQLMLNLEGQNLHSAYERLLKDQAALRVIAASIWAGSHDSLTVLNRTVNVDENISNILDFAEGNSPNWQDNDELVIGIESMRKVIAAVQSRLVGN